MHQALRDRLEVLLGLLQREDQIPIVRSSTLQQRRDQQHPQHTTAVCSKRKVCLRAPALKYQLKALKNAAVAEPRDREVERVADRSETEVLRGALKSFAGRGDAGMFQQRRLGRVDRLADRIERLGDVIALKQPRKDRV